MKEFYKNDSEYKKWIENSNGFVFNPKTNLVHKSNCQHIADFKNKLTYTNEKSKFCFGNKYEITNWLVKIKKWTNCGNCKPGL